MAPKKTTRVQKKAALATKKGFTSPAAMQSVTRQYGLVKNASGKWVKPDAAFLERQMVANGWGMGQTGTTPVSIGGDRWLTGQGQLTYTGQRSDSAKRNPGAAYNAPASEQVSTTKARTPAKNLTAAQRKARARRRRKRS